MKIHLEYFSRIAVLHISGDLRLYGREAEAQALMATFRRGISVLPTRLILNLDGTTQLDTTGIAAVARMVKECSEAGIPIKGHLPSGMTGQALRMLRLFDRPQTLSAADHRFDEELAEVSV